MLSQVAADCTFEVLVTDLNLEVVEESPLPHSKADEILLECDAVSDSWSEHHLITIGEVVHHIFDCWFEGIFVYEHKVDLIISHDLDSDISSAEKDIAA